MNTCFNRKTNRQMRSSSVPTHPVQLNSSLCSCPLLTAVDISTRAVELPLLKCVLSAERQELTEWLCYSKGSRGFGEKYASFHGYRKYCWFRYCVFWQMDPLTNIKCSLIVQFTLLFPRMKYFFLLILVR